MQAESESKRKNEEFRCKIRRGEIEHFFEERRREILKIQDDEEIRKELNTAAKQHEFLSRCGLELTGEPNSAWGSSLTKLRRACSFFSGQFDGWLSVGIVNSLTLLFRQQYKHLLLAAEASLLLADMTYLSWDSGTDFINKLMEYEIVPAVATLIGDPIYDIRQRLDMMSLLSNIANCDHKAREKSVRDGAGRVLIELGREVLDNTDKNIAHLARFLGASVGFLKVLRKPKGMIPPNSNLVLSFIGLLGIIFQKEVSNRVNKNALFCLLQILKMEKETIYANVFNIPGAIPRLLQLLVCGESDLRQQAVTAFNYLTYSDSIAITTHLCGRGLLDKLFQGYSIPNRLDIYVKTMLMTVSNLAVSSDAISEGIFMHPIFNAILEQFDNPKHQIVKEVYYCMNSIISKLKYNNLERLIGCTPVLEHLVKGLIDFRDHEHKTIHDLLGTFVVLIERTEEVYHYNSNPLLDKLERTYNFSGLLENISGESRNRVTVEMIGKLQDIILAAHCEPEMMGVV